MGNIDTAGLMIILANFLFSYNGIKNHLFFDKYKFEVDKILIEKDYKRFITSGFLHTGWLHLIFNMLALYSFSGIIESHLGEWKFLLIYFGSLIGGDLFSLFVHRLHGDYSSVGASGAVCGIIFASIALFPGMDIDFFGLISIPSWLFGLVYTLYSIYGIKSKKNNIGHEAHLGGAVIGMLLAILMEPSVLLSNYVTILIITVPSLFFIYMVITRPEMLLIDNYFFKKHNVGYSIEDRYNATKNIEQHEIDEILEKIHQKGMKSLTKSEKQKLQDYSQTVK